MNDFLSKILLLSVGVFAFAIPARAESNFNPSFIISDPEMQDFQSMDTSEIQNFLDSKGSYLRTGLFVDTFGTQKSAANIIFDASQAYQINPKFLLVTLQKEQSLITDDTPSQRQLDWATGYAVCDGCYINDPRVQKFKGFGKQVDGAAGIIRWYYENNSNGIVKKKDTPIRIDEMDVTPGSWATAFLYTYTPHLHGNSNFWRIWNTWFSQLFPNGTLLQSSSSSEYWLIDNGFKRHFKSKTALITRLDPKLAIKVDESDLQNYTTGPEIAFPNYSLLNDGATTYLLDYDTLRPFESESVVRSLGFNPDELIDVQSADIIGYKLGQSITASTTAPQGIIVKITDLVPNIYYYYKDNVLFPLTDPAVVQTNFKNIPTERHKMKEFNSEMITSTLIGFADGTLLQTKDSNIVYVIENGKKRPLADDDTFLALGYKRSNILTVDVRTAAVIFSGERIFVNNNLKSASSKYLGDSEVQIPDQYGKAASAAYLVAEFPSGRIISGKNIDTRQPIASVTKLLTAYEALQNNFKLANSTIYSKNKYESVSNSLKLKDGDKVRNKDMFYTMLVASDNSAARLVAGNSTTDEVGLIKKINQRLEDWGADYTTIADVTGLGEGNKSTARDLLKIFTKVLQNKDIKDALSSPSYRYTELSSKDRVYSHSYLNTNQIIKNVPFAKRSYKILATKTGYTDEAKAVLVMLIEAKKTKKQYVVITLGNSNYEKRFEEPHKIAEWVSKNKIILTSK
ncbi:MAG: serine hydrolase [Patescibacteria group bacterium]|jgi:D-alanyl-D-alanine carboxypeptidase